MEVNSVQNQNPTETATGSNDIATEEEEESSSSPEDPLTAIQEAATILMEAESQKHRWSTTNQEDTTTTNTTLIPILKKRTRTRIPWSVRMEQLAEYKRLHGNLLIPIRYKKNPSLGKFVHNTREQYKLFHNQASRRGHGQKKKPCSLTQDRIRELQELGFVFSTERKRIEKEDWDARFQQLLQFQQEHGHTMVPYSFVTDKPFADWVHRQRTTFTQMQKQNITSSSSLLNKVARRRGGGHVRRGRRKLPEGRAARPHGATREWR